MMKKSLITFLLMMMLSVYNISCSSNQAEDDSAQETSASADGEEGEEGEEGEFESDEELVADGEGDELEEGDEEGDDLEEGDEEGDDLEADLGEDEEGEEGDDELAEEGAETEEGSEDALAESTEDIAEPVDETVEGVASSEPIDEGLGEDVSEEIEKPTWIPVKKIVDAPFNKRGTLVNTVYLARPGDDINAISQKIYGTDKTSDLLTVNPWLGRGIKTGDKVYYNSPNRPDDNSVLKTYYEDVGLTPEIYVSKSGDNIRRVSSDLLGDNDAWKEVWATNPDVESKMEIPEGTQLRYWASTDGMTNVADNNEPPPQNIEDELPPPPEQASNDLPPAAGSASNDPPPPPPPPPAPPSQASNDLPPPPPPAPDMAASGSLQPPPPPAPPKPKRINKRGKKKTMAMSEDKDDLMTIAIGGILLLAAIVLLARKRKARSSSMDFNTHTQIE